MTRHAAAALLTATLATSLAPFLGSPAATASARHHAAGHHASGHHGAAPHTHRPSPGTPGGGPSASEPVPSPGCSPSGAQPGPVPSGGLWAQKKLALSGLPKGVTGAGVTVAVVDTGVDFTPQLAHKVSGIPLVSGGLGDCDGQGTEVASIIAATPLSNPKHGTRQDGFTGVAPKARILSVKVAQGEQASAAQVASGIETAVSNGAQVIDVSIGTKGNSGALAQALRTALGHGCVVVAAAGDGPLGTSLPDGPSYQAHDPGLLSVGAVASDGAVYIKSEYKKLGLISKAEVTAPGVGLTVGWPGKASEYVSGQTGSSLAAAYVSGLAALVRQAFPGITAAQVVQRIEATAVGYAGPGSGAGLIDPVAALTYVLQPSLRTHQAAVPAPPVPVTPAPPAPRTPLAALALAAGLVAAAVAAVLGALVTRHGRRRHWRPGTDRRGHYPGAGADPPTSAV